MFEELSVWFGVDPLVAGGMLLVAWGWVLWLLRELPQKIWKAWHLNFVMQVEVLNTDEALYWL